MIVLDANVLIAYFSDTDSHHTEATAILETTFGGDLALSALTLAEVLVWPARRDRTGEATRRIRDLGVEILPLAEGCAAEIAEIRAGSALRMPDAVVLHTAVARRATLATFDDALAREARARGLEVVGL